MGVYDFYEQRIFPRVLDVAMRSLAKHRAPTLEPATGDVLEIGFGTGLNLPHYDASRVRKIWALEPSAGMRHKARSGVGASPLDIEFIELPAEEIPLDVLYEDDDVIVLDKPPGMVVHPAPGHPRGTLVNALLHHCRAGGGLAAVGGVERPGIVHRLDKGTSGVMVVARNDAAHVALAVQFHDHTIERLYWSFVRALPGADAGRVDQPIGRHPTDRKRMSVRTRSGREAATNWGVSCSF